MTKALYDELPYDREFEAKVIELEKEDGYYKLILDQTLFFPEQGGQSSDIGYIDGIKIYDVQIIDGTIYHYLKLDITNEDERETAESSLENRFLPDTIIRGTIDWNHRFNNMQQHTGEHIFTGIAHKKYGAENVGFHLSDNTVTLDLNIELTKEQIDDIETKANEVIANNVPVICYYPSELELDKIEYRSKKEIEGAVRLVEIEGVDICACCAPHVSSTSQVGLLKVLSATKYKGGTRVSILCGLRALTDYRQKQHQLEESIKLLNCPLEEVSKKASKLLEENKTLKYKLSQIQSEGFLREIAKYNADENLGKEDVIIFTEGVETKALRDGVNLMMSKHKGICAVFNEEIESKFNFILGSELIDCNDVAATLRAIFDAKCGGSNKMIQGSIEADAEEIRATLDNLKNIK